MAPNKNQLRIIGGALRGRKIHFPDIKDIRPTPDFVRETLFNWLMHVIQDACCLDLFSGSGALGIEALSRGAKHVTFVDKNPIAISHIKMHLENFKLSNNAVLHAQIPTIITTPPSPFNIIFLDPPFHQNMIEVTSSWIDTQSWLADEAYIYIEAERELKNLPVPNTWELLKHKISGQVSYNLYKKNKL